MSTARISRNDPCPCGSGKKFKHCCHANAFGNGVPHPRPVPTDGAFLRRGPEPPRKPPPQLKPITRVAVEYAISDALGKAEVTFCYELGTPIIMADGNVLPVEYLKAGMQFRLEDGGVATTTKVEEPKVWEPPSQERDANGNSLRRVIGRVHYNGYFPRMDFGVPGDVIKTTPGHLFFSVTRGDWHPIETFQRGEYFRNEQGMSVPVEWISPMRWEFCDLYNVEVEEYHTYFVGGGPSGGIWSHNGLGQGCRVPRAASDRMPRADRFPSRDFSGRLHGDIPRSVPGGWRQGEIRDAISEVQGSLARRRGNMAIFGEEGGHRARIAQEEAWLRQLLRRLDDLR
jgi:hypothetical protein